MDQGIFISSLVLWIFGVLVSLLLGLGGIAVKVHFRRQERDKAELLAMYKQTQEQIAELHRAIVDQQARYKAELLAAYKQSDERSEERHRATVDQRARYKAELLAAYKQTQEQIAERHRATVDQRARYKAELLAAYKQTQEQIAERHRSIVDQRARDKAELLAAYKQTQEQIAERHRSIVDQRARDKAELLAMYKQSDERNEERHRDTQTGLRDIQSALRDLSYRVGRAEGAGSVPEDAAPRSGRHSQRRGHDPSPGIDGEPGPAQVVERYAGSMGPLAGGRAEAAHATGLARQAVPDQEQAGQRDGETGPDPSAEESPDPAG